MFGSPSIGGWNKVYVDTRTDGWYLLWILSRLDSDDFGPSDWYPSIVSWTPKNKGDSLRKAGYRLFWAAALGMDYVNIDSFYNDEYDKTGLWKDEWVCSPLCLQVFASIRKISYKDDKEFEDVLAGTPEFLKPHLSSRRFPG